MSAEKSQQTNGLEQTVAERTVTFRKNIGENKKQFIINQAQVGLLHFLADARTQLDALEARLYTQLGKPSSPLFSLFTSKKKIVPAAAVQDISSEFETARHLLFEINEFILFKAGETNLVRRAAYQRDIFEADINKLKAGGRVKKYWNDTEEFNLSAETIEQRRQLGTISKPKIFNILNEVHEELTIFPTKLKELLKTTHERVCEDIAHHVESVHKDFAATPLGKYLVVKFDLKTKTEKLQTEGKPPAGIEKNLRKQIQAVQAAQDGLTAAELKTAEQIEQTGLCPKTKLDTLIVALPEDRFKQLIQQIDKAIHLQDNHEPPPASHSQYRRYTSNS